MTDYITLVINEELFETIFWLLIVTLIFLMDMNVIDLIEKEIEKNKREKKRRNAEPYRKEYEKLLKEEKYQEALAYSEKYGKLFRDCYYY